MTAQEKIQVLKALEPHTEVYYQGPNFGNGDGSHIVSHGQTGLKVRNTPRAENYMSVAFTINGVAKIYPVRMTELTCAAILVTEKLQGIKYTKIKLS